VLIDIPAVLTELPRGAGNIDGSGIPAGARCVAGDMGWLGYFGAAPPPGIEHRYIFTVHALALDILQVPDSASPALVGVNLTNNTLARAYLTAKCLL